MSAPYKIYNAQARLFIWDLYLFNNFLYGNH